MSRPPAWLDGYETVAERRAKFWADHPRGRIETRRDPSEPGEFIVLAALYRDGETTPFATGWAHEVIGRGEVNTTSALENCETSALGRALENGNYPASTGNRREQRSPSEERPPPTPPKPPELAGKATLNSLAARILALDTAGVAVKAEWKSAGLPRLEELPLARVGEAAALLARLEGSEEAAASPLTTDEDEPASTPVAPPPADVNGQEPTSSEGSSPPPSDLLARARSLATTVSDDDLAEFCAATGIPTDKRRWKAEHAERLVLWLEAV